MLELTSELTSLPGGAGVKTLEGDRLLEQEQISSSMDTCVEYPRTCTNLSIAFDFTMCVIYGIHVCDVLCEIWS